MAGPYFVYMNGTFTDGLSWAGAFDSIDDALGTAAAGETIFVAHDHSKTYTAAIVFDNSGTIISPIYILCVNRTTGAKAITALEQTTNSSYSLNPFDDNLIIEGVLLKSANTVNMSVDSTVNLIDCLFELVTNANDDLTVFDDTDVIWRNVEFKAASTTLSQITLSGGSNFAWNGGSTGSTFSNVFNLSGTRAGKLTLKNIDFSNVANSIMSLSTTISAGLYKVLMTGCKIPSSFSILASSSFTVPHEVIVHSCDNGDTKEYFEEIYLEGQIVYATNCFRTNSSVEFSAKMTPNANALDHIRPLRFRLCPVYTDANPTLTVEMIGTVELQSDECWLEIEYPNETTEALRDVDDSSRVTYGWSGGSGPGTPDNLETSTEGWTENLTSELKRKIAVTIANGAAGIHTVYVCIAKDLSGAEESVYCDPDVTVS